MYITTKYDGQIAKKKRSLMDRFFRLFYHGPLWDDMERVSEMGKDSEAIIIVPEDDEDDF